MPISTASLSESKANDILFEAASPREPDLGDRLDIHFPLQENRTAFKTRVCQGVQSAGFPNVDCRRIPSAASATFRTVRDKLVSLSKEA